MLCKSMDWFLYDRDFRHERVNAQHYLKEDLLILSGYFTFFVSFIVFFLLSVYNFSAERNITSNIYFIYGILSVLLYSVLHSAENIY